MYNEYLMQPLHQNKNALLKFVDEVFSFLPTTKDYESYRTIFINEEISVDIACDLDDEALEEIAISKKIHRSKILRTIQNILTKNPPGSARSPASLPPGSSITPTSNSRPMASRPSVVGHQPNKRSRTPPGLYNSPPRRNNHTPGKNVQRGEPEYVPGQSRMFFMNMKLLKPNNVNWEVTLERYFSQYGQSIKVVYLHQKKLAFVELVIDPGHVNKFPSPKLPFTHHTIQGHRLTLKVANHPPYGPKTNELVVKVGSRVAGLWKGKYLPATVCEIKSDLVFVLFDGYEGFKEAISRKVVKHLNQVDSDSETSKIHDWVCSKCRNNCFGSKPTCKICGEVSPSTKKMRALKPGASVTCSFETDRHRAVVERIVGKLVFVRKAGAEIVEPTTVWDIEMVGPDEGRSLITGTPGAPHVPSKKRKELVKADLSHAGKEGGKIPDQVMIERKIRHWVQNHPSMCLAKLCGSVEIPYRAFGFQSATAFLHSMQDVKISPHPQNFLTLVGKNSKDSNDLRKRIEAKIVTWVTRNREGRVNTLCSRVKIPYQVWGFAKPMGFLKSMDNIIITDHPSHMGVRIVNLRSTITTKDELRQRVVSFVESVLKSKQYKFTEYVPYNICLKEFNSDAKNLGYARLLDFIQHDIHELEIEKKPDARVFLRGERPAAKPLNLAAKIVGSPMKSLASKVVGSRIKSQNRDTLEAILDSEDCVTEL